MLYSVLEERERDQATMLAITCVVLALISILMCFCSYFMRKNDRSELTLVWEGAPKCDLKTPEICQVCDSGKEAVTKCTFRYDGFEGCDKSFCADCGHVPKYK